MQLQLSWVMVKVQVTTHIYIMMKAKGIIGTVVALTSES